MWISRLRRGFNARTPDNDASYELVPPDSSSVHNEVDVEEIACEVATYDVSSSYPSNTLSHSHSHPQTPLPGPPPTTHQATTLTRIPGRIPRPAYAIALVEFAERASYYGVGGVFVNFIQRPLPVGGSGTGAPPAGSQVTPGALGMGLQVSTALTVIFTLMAYTTPLVGGVLADMRWGKFKTIAVGTGLAGIAHLLSIYAALPSLLQSGTAFPPFLASLLLLGSSAGLIKANIAPLMAEQYTPQSDYVTTLDTGDKVIVDREATVQRIMSAYFHSINVGAFMAIVSTFAEKYVGFWLAFLIPGVIFFLMPPLLFLVRPHLVPASPPSSSALIDAYKLARQALSRSDALHLKETDHDDVSEHLGQVERVQHVSEIRQAFDVCKLFLFFAIYNVADGGLNALMTSLAGTMTTNGIPNDFLEKVNPLAIVISIPLLNRYFYPFLFARKIPFGPVRRVVVGFILSAMGMLWLAVLQHAVYITSPCGYSATTCEVGTGVSPLSAWLVLPAPLLTGLSESLAVVSAMELGYTMSPPGLKSIVTSLFLFMQAISAGLVLAFLPLMRDPVLVWPFALIAIFTLIAAAGVWKLFGHFDKAA